MRRHWKAKWTATKHWSCHTRDNNEKRQDQKPHADDVAEQLDEALRLLSGEQNKKGKRQKQRYVEYDAHQHH